MAKSNNRYQQLIEKIFFDQYKSDDSEIYFERVDLEYAAEALDIKLPKNLGDVIYAVRYRLDMPDSILQTQPVGMEWIIEGAGRAKYVVKLVKINRILPNPELITTKIPDSTPEIVSSYSC